MLERTQGWVVNLDMYLSESGDLRVAAGGDIAFTETRWREDAQNAYVRLMTTPGDFALYPSLGADLDALYGLPQSEATGRFGIDIIKKALEDKSVFAGRAITVVAVPTGEQTIRFDVKIKSGDKMQNLISIEKDLGIDY